MMSYLCTQPLRMLRFFGSRMTTDAAQNQLFVTHGALRFSPRLSLFKKLWNVSNKLPPRLSILVGLRPTCYMRCQ
jgi:hypothetical protein